MRNNRCFGGLTVKMFVLWSQWSRFDSWPGQCFFTLNHLHCHHQRMLRLGSVFVRALLVWHRWQDQRPIRRQSPGRSPEERGRKNSNKVPSYYTEYGQCPTLVWVFHYLLTCSSMVESIFSLLLSSLKALRRVDNSEWRELWIAHLIYSRSAPRSCDQKLEGYAPHIWLSDLQSLDPNIGAYPLSPMVLRQIKKQWMEQTSL